MPQVSLGDATLNVLDEGRGRPLLLVHGFPLDHTMWQGQVRELAGKFRVLAPDLRGFGQSSPVTDGAAVLTMEQLAADLARMLAAMKVAEPVIFCGLSMGGYVAWQFAAAHPDKLARLILCDTKAAGDTPDAAANRHKTAQKVLAEGSQVMADSLLPKLFSKQSIDSRAPCLEATRQVILRTQPAAIAAALRGMAEREDFTPRLSSIGVPTLVLCGAEDAISPPAEMRTIAAAIPRAQYVEISGAGHMAPLEQPGTVNRAILDFLGR